VPIRYVNQGYPREELAGFYRACEMALITPLRDGMNLVAKEYVAAQDPPTRAS
jgi:trehalose 6-phosphate synthase